MCFLDWFLFYRKPLKGKIKSILLFLFYFLKSECEVIYILCLPLYLSYSNFYHCEETCSGSFMKHLFLIYLISGGALFTIGDIFMKKWATHDRYIFYGIGFVFYIIGIILFSLTLKWKNLWVANTILVTSNIVFLALVSYFYFHEKLSLLQLIWLWLSIIWVIFLELGE